MTNKPIPQSPLYSPAERIRRDATPWTMVQGVLAPIQFFVFIGSAILVMRYLLTGEGLTIATASVVLKTCLLYLIMVTGCIWEKEVFGVYLFAHSFYWEDVVSMLVLSLHTFYLVSFVFDLMSPRAQMWLALAAYSTYVINATQFVLKRFMAPTAVAELALLGVIIASCVAFAALCHWLVERPSIGWSRRIALKPRAGRA